MITPNQIISASTGTPGISSGRILAATGASIGITMNAISKKSMNIPRMKTRMFTTIRKPIAPPGRLSNRCSTQTCPSAALNVNENTVEPIRMNITKLDSRVVLTSACLSRAMFNRLRATAITSAPTAPIAPPSVGVATPRKMVPSTRKISTSGGIRTKVTCSASLDSSPIRVTRLMIASASATNDATVIDMMKISSPGAARSRPTIGLMMPSCTIDHA